MVLMDDKTVPSEKAISRRLAEAYRPGALAFSESHIEDKEASSWKRAAVLLPLIWQEDAWHLLFIRRTETVRHHKGEVAFPGGSSLGEETPEQTALREAAEEINLSPENVCLLGRLNDIMTATNYRVMPVVGRLSRPCHLRAASGEVARIFKIPLSWLAQRANWRLSFFDPGGGRRPFPVIVYRQYQGEVLWGATARITHNFLQTIGLLEEEMGRLS